MQFINLVSSVPSSTFAEFYLEANYGGSESVQTRGDYSVDKLFAGPVKSVKLSEFASVTFYESTSGPGKSVKIDNDSAELNLDFTPAVVAVTSHVKAFKSGTPEVLDMGEYGPDDIRKYDKLAVPRGLYLIFMGNKDDANSVHLFENEVYTVDSRLDGYDKVAIIALGKNDVRINFKNSEELSDDDLLAVAGGACKVDACGGKACGADGVCAAEFAPCGVN
ncbi:MAG: hypothetical protein LIQ31_07650 [Planctomycetes bacterium]|nr:hypothetical protein [Planctomycetota bacterium]